MSLRIENLTKNYGNVKALDNFSLEVNSGEFMVLLGPSGCGKTTVVRCIAGLLDPTAGQIHIGDQLVNHLAPKDRDIAMVFQNYALYPHMNVYVNIAFP
jgi:multiple sugar transport system ATP-binding protein